MRGKHQDFNPSLPKGNEKVFGTLGVAVPVRRRGRLPPQHFNEKGTSVATAVMAGLAAIIVGYINVNSEIRDWDNIRTHRGFQNLLLAISTEQEQRKLFFSLERHLTESQQGDLEAALTRAANFLE